MFSCLIQDPTAITYKRNGPCQASK